MQQPGQSNLESIPGVGKKIVMVLRGLGFHSVQDLAGQDPEELYLRICSQRSVSVDRCVLYVFRCAVYYASNESHDPNLLKWWNWKDS